MTPTHPHAILFDLGNTLLREESFDPIPGILALLEGLSVAPRVEVAEEIASFIREEIRQVYASGPEEFSFRQAVPGILERLGLEEVRSAAELEHDLFRSSARLSLPEGVMDVLNLLKSRDIPMGIVSNAIFSGELLEETIASHGIDEFFQFLISSADHGFRKPDRSIFDAAIEKIGVSRENTWFVGDSWSNDVIGASESGLTPFWLHAEDDPAPDATIHHRLRRWKDFQRFLET